MATQLKSDGINLAESSAPTAASDHGVIYVKADGHAYFSSVGGSGGDVAETKLNSQSASSVAADDISAGDAAVSLSTTSGDVTVDSNAGAISIDGHTGVTIASSNSGNISIDSVAELHLNSTTGDIKFQDGGTDQLALDLDGTGGEVIMKLMVDSDDFVFQQYDGTEVFRVEDNGDFDIAGGLGSTGVTVSAAGAISADGRIVTDDTTAATSTTDGSLQTDGGLSVALDAVVGDDLYLLSDGAVIHFGAASDITLTHVLDTGLIIQQATETTAEPVLTLKNTGDLASGPILDFVLDNGAGEANDDVLGLVRFYGDDAGDNATLFASIKALSTNVAESSEAGSLVFSAFVGGTEREIVVIGDDAGLTLPNAATYGVAKALSFVTYSDETLKENIQPMNNALDKVKSLQGVTYNWKSDGHSDIGFIAQDVEKVIPEVVATTGEEGGYAMDYARMTALLVEGMKEQQAQIEELKSVIVKLSNGKTISAKMGKVKLS